MEAEAKVGGGRAAFQAQIRDLKASLHSQGETAEANEVSESESERERESERGWARASEDG